ncbi:MULTISPECIES: amino acid adenylation domain-containing protein [Dickeya]|uniref:Chrysobactin synthetase component F, serine activating enzyme n=1 Tax=Dickeya aquatica TaxID=1401087 RepID=A0A375A8E2_9GAMM|nr:MULTISPECIES: non-ribosomal peptide synthetase [Dickeya]SLM62267.1 Chrysobactin synthetase component F, serine activating enzyme [Dickeya aquatica]
MSESCLTSAHGAAYRELPLVAAQPGIWMAEQIASEPNVFTVAHALELHGPIDPACLSLAIREGLAEADTVQARFGLNADGVPVQWLPEPADGAAIIAAEVLDLSARDDGEQAAFALMHDDLAAALPADGDQPLYRQVIMRVSAAPERWFWYQRFHHLMLDGFSFEALTQRIVTIYNARLRGETPPPSPFTSFAEVVAEYQAWQHAEDNQRDAAFWQQHARDLPAPVSLAADIGEVPPAAARHLHHALTLPAAPLVSLAQQLGARVQATDVVMAALMVYLHRMSGDARLSVGFPFMRRMGSAALSATGPVVNVLPLQLHIQAGMTLTDVVRDVQAEIQRVRRHQRYDAEQLRRDLGLVGGSEALYGPVINVKVYHTDITLGDTPVTPHVLAMGPVDDLEFTLGMQGSQLQLTLVANPARYDASALQAHAQRLETLITRLAQQPERDIRTLPLLDEQEWRNIDSWGRGPQLTLPPALHTVLDCLQQQVMQQPDALAVVCGEVRLSYRQLSARAMQLARWLMAQGIGPGEVVAIAVPRSVDSVVAIFGVLACGAAYMPLDLDYPKERLALMCEDAQPAMVLTHQRVQAQIPALSPVQCLDDAHWQAVCARLSGEVVTDQQRRTPLRGEHLAYMIYTSGSTGKPKGVMSTHAGLLNLMMSHSSFLFGPAIARFAKQHGRRLRAGHTASFSFDSSWEPLFCMMMGSELHIFDEELRKDAWALVQHLTQTPIDLLDITPSFFTQMIDSGLLEADNHQPAFVMIGGEAATPRLWQLMRQHPQMEIHNYYGPSEYTIDTLGARVTLADQPVLGQPVANTRVWLLDNALQPVPVGVAGELYIAGPGLARGYLHRPDLTASRFVACPFIPGAVMYRTGDLMRWRHDGQLTFIGRSDHQIKIRGFRVELGEVENALVALEQVSSAVVIAEPLGATHRLIGYCSLPDAAERQRPDIAARLLEQLAQHLPDYMLPSVLMVMAELPLTVNGKIDRQALPKPEPAQESVGRAPETAHEQMICQAIARLLKLTTVSAEADFFALGGDSISAMGLGTLLRREGWVLRPKTIFAERTPARMAQALQPLDTQQAINASQRYGVLDGLPIVHSFARQAGLNTLFAHGVFVSLPPALQAEHLAQACRALAQAHPALCAVLRDGQLVIEASVAPAIAQSVWPVSLSQTLDQCADEAFEYAVARLDPAAGVMAHAVLLQRAEEACALVLVAHHLVVDGVSWRTLLPELRQAAMAAMAGQSCVLPAESCSLYDWSASLKSQVVARRAELPFWQAVMNPALARLGRVAFDPVRDREGTRGQQRRILDAGLTQAVLTTLPVRFQARVDEVLLAAFVSACQQRFGVQPLRLMLESHGRSDSADGLDPSRTVGWLTAEYPVLIEPAAQSPHEPAAQLRQVKRALRAVPDYGIGYGILRYLDEHNGNPLASLEHAVPEVLFNYLGRFDSQDGLWAPRQSPRHFRDAFAVTQSPDMPLSHPLDINIFVDEQGAEPQLAIHWGFAQAVFTPEDIDALHQGMVAALAQWHDRTGQDAQYDTCVAAEVALAEVSDNTLDALRQHYGPLAAVLPVLPLQQGLLFHTQVADNSGSYNSLTRLSLRGPLSASQLRQALEAVVRQYPQLAARFDTTLTPQPLQLLPLLRHDVSYWPLESRTLAAMSAEEEQACLREMEQAELARDLLCQPSSLLHALLVSHADGERHTLFLNAHHLVVDGWSTPVFLHALFTALYQGPAALTPPSVPYSHIIHQLAARDAQASRQRWREVLAEARPTLLFGDGPHTGEVRELALSLPPEQEQRLLALCRQSGLTLNTVMQGVWGLLLSACSGADDVVFGSPVSGRFGQIDGIEQHVGLFSNTLPVRVRFEADRPLLAQLAELQAQQIQLVEHDDIGLGEIQHIAGRGTLFDTLLVVENYPDGEALSQPGQALRCEAVTNRGYTHYPLTLLVLPGQRLQLLMEYRASVAQPQQLAQRLLLLLTQLIETPERALSDWDWLLPQELALLEATNQTEWPLPPGTLPQALAGQAGRTPDLIALVDAEHQLRYRQVRLQTRLLADRLIDAGVQPGDIVAVALPRSVRLSLALYAIVEIGAAWLPLDTGYPDDRLALMVEDATPRLIITEKAEQARFSALAPLLLLDTLADERLQPRHAPVVVQPEQAAYVLYTSGSTGRPKGVVVGHQAIVNRLAWMQHQYPLQADDVVLQKTPCSFDVSVWEFFWPLMTGARLVMAPPQAHRDPQAIRQLIDDYGVTTLHFVPSMLAAWVSTLERWPRESIGCASLRRVFCSGEALSRELALSYQSLLGSELHNLYGPTEAAVDVTWQPAFGAALEHCALPGIPIGRPVWNTRLRILDSALRPVPPGVPGDLYLCGVQLAQGYLRRPSLTASRFVADPFACGERMYRTGDIARWLDDGAVEYLGRSDDQLKIRGQRIELGEIEQVLLAQPGVAQAVVGACALGDAGQWHGADARQLVAWLVAQADTTLEPERIQQALAQQLPAHMVPAHYVVMDAFPLSANGKLDRKALPAPVARQAQGQAPNTPSQRAVAALFCALLACDAVSLEDDFFALGGHSLLAMRLAADIRRQVQRTVSVGQIIAARTVERIALLLEDNPEQTLSDGNGETLPLRAGQGPVLFCLHPASGFAWQYSGLLRYLNGDYPIVGLQSPRPEGVIAQCDNLDAMCERHLATIRHHQPQGPYYLLGYSLGGTLAHGIAARLQQAGETVSFLGLLDTYPPEGQDWRTPDEADAREEVEREQAGFMADTETEDDPQLRAERAAMFGNIVANYQDAVRLLSTARSWRYDGEATLFVATRTVPQGMDIPATWAPYVSSLVQYPQPCEHADILSPASLVELGPLLNKLLRR